MDCVVAETFSWAEEAAIATEECNRLGLPSIVNMALFAENKQGQVDHTNDGYSVPDCFKYLKDIGATVVGLNCFRGPATTLPLLQQAVTAGVSGRRRGVVSFLSPLPRSLRGPGPFAAVGLRWEEIGLFVRSGLDLKMKSVFLFRRDSSLNARYQTVTGCDST